MEPLAALHVSLRLEHEHLGPRKRRSSPARWTRGVPSASTLEVLDTELQRAAIARSSVLPDGYRLGFAGESAAWGGVATVVRDRQGRVPGLVWALVAEDLERLDRFEGHPVSYERRRLLIEQGDGKRRRAYVYVKDDPEATLPTEAYFGVLWRAYREHGFDELGLALALGGLR